MLKYNYFLNRLNFCKIILISILIDNRMFPLCKTPEICQPAAASKLTNLGFFLSKGNRHSLFTSYILIPYVKGPALMCILMPCKKIYTIPV